MVFVLCFNEMKKEVYMFGRFGFGWGRGWGRGGGLGARLGYCPWTGVPRGWRWWGYWGYYPYRPYIPYQVPRWSLYIPYPYASYGETYPFGETERDGRGI